MRYALIAAAIGAAAASPLAGNDWVPVPTTTPSKPAEWTPVYTPAPTWAPAPPPKCSTTSTYTTKECGTNYNAWDNCKDYTKTTVVELEKCPSTWAPVPTTWAPAPAPVKCSTTSVYTTKECGTNYNAWDNCKDYTKTTVVELEKCPVTWAPAPAPATTWAPVPAASSCSSTSSYTTKVCGTNTAAWDNCKEVATYTVVSIVCPASTWAPAPAPATTWAPVATPAATSSWSPISTYKGAADKQAVGMGALAIAAVAALL